jgi:hypothetical protein
VAKDRGRKSAHHFRIEPPAKDQILRWAALVGVDVAARIAPVIHGATDFGPLLSAQELKRGAAMAHVNCDSFVLSVGTIDKRRNQTLLCNRWWRPSARRSPFAL